jgi:hypothetical protein
VYQEGESANSMFLIGQEASCLSRARQFRQGEHLNNRIKCRRRWHANASLKVTNLIRISVSEAFDIELGIELAYGDKGKAVSASKIELAGNK